MAPQLAETRGKLLKAGDAALLQQQAARCKGPLDRLLITHEGCFARFVPVMRKNSKQPGFYVEP